LKDFTVPNLPETKEPLEKERYTPSPEEKGSDPEKNIEKLGVMTLPRQDNEIFTLTIIGQIEGHMVLPPPD
jgi:hypothetical protein